MANKVDISEAIEFSGDLQETSTDIQFPVRQGKRKY